MIKQYNAKIKAISIALILFIFISIFPLQVTAATTDYDNDWAKEIIQSFIDRKIITPDENGNVQPTKLSTRAEVATVINKAFGFTKTAKIEYIDVQSTDSFYKDVQIAKGTGYMIGGDGVFRPNASITRQEMAIIVSRLLELTHDINAAKVFTDFDKIPTDESKGAVGSLTKTTVVINDKTTKIIEGKQLAGTTARRLYKEVRSALKSLDISFIERDINSKRWFEGITLTDEYEELIKAYIKDGEKQNN